MSYQITPKFHKTDAIEYLTYVRQGDYLVLILFILNVDLLSFLSNKLPGLTAGNLENAKIRFPICFFVYYIKMYTQDAQEAICKST